MDLLHMLQSDSCSITEIVQLLDRHEMEHIELEFLQNWLLPPDDYRREKEKNIRETLLEFSQRVDSRYIKVGNPQGYPVPQETLARRFRQLCDEASTYNTEIAFEVFPYDPNVVTMAELVDLVDETTNGGVILDSWQIGKSSIDLERISELGEENVFGAELADGYGRTDLDYRRESLNMRKLPGYGELDIESFVHNLRTIGFNEPWGVEMLSKEYRMLPKGDAYPRAYEAGRQFV